MPSFRTLTREHVAICRGVLGNGGRLQNRNGTITEWYLEISAIRIVSRLHAYGRDGLKLLLEINLTHPHEAGFSGAHRRQHDEFGGKVRTGCLQYRLSVGAPGTIRTSDPQDS